MSEAREMDELLALLREIAAHDGCHFHQFFPDEDRLIEGTTIYSRASYPKHIEFFAAGARYPQRLFMAANRVGKSEAGAFEVTCHLTGLYPPWWEGRRFDGPTEWWAAGTTGETTRDIVQTKLLGPVTPDGGVAAGGMLPPDRIVHTQKKTHGLPGAIESVWVRHVTGGISVVSFKTYEQGRKSFEGTAKHGFWGDEEPPEDVYTEALYRTATTDGIVIITFTPLQGMSEVVKGFLEPDTEEARGVKRVIQAGWDDVPHLNPTVKAALLATTPPFQRDARTKGVPQLGAGAIYGFPESELRVPDFDIPKHWKRCFGLDAGGGANATAAVWLALDPTSRVVYLTSAYKRESPEVAVHIAALKARGEKIPGVGDASALLLTAHDAEQLISVYQRAGLDIELPDKAVESGIQDVWELMSAGRFKVFASATAWWDEFRYYHRDEKGRIVKKNDHALDATRYAVRSGLRRAKSWAELEQRPVPVSMPTVAGAQGWMRG